MKNILNVSIMVLYTFSAFAQKLPTIQEKGVRAPANVKVDGKATEWNNTYQAYNKANMIYYTLANDDENLYLVVSCNNRGVASKILYNGITLALGKDKKNGNLKSITFPRPQVDSWRLFYQLSIGESKALKVKPPLTQSQIDSLNYLQRRQKINDIKYLLASGISSMPDTLYSIYNSEGVKARAGSDIKGVLTYELSIPLKYLDLDLLYSKNIHYILTLNGTLSSKVLIGTIMGWTLDDIALITLIDPTSFEGEYTLAKK